MTPEEQALLIMLSVPVSNREGESDKMQELIAAALHSYGDERAAAEREECAKLADDVVQNGTDARFCRAVISHVDWRGTVMNIAEAIRARNKSVP